jgi:hypothetical protein
VKSPAASKAIAFVTSLLAVAALQGCSSSEEGSESAATPEQRCESLRFDAAQWERASRAEDDEADGLTERQRLADVLVECQTLVGMSRAEVTRIFGPPDEHAVHHVEYLIGFERGTFRLDGEYLDIRFDSDDRVVDVQIHE